MFDEIGLSRKILAALGHPQVIKKKINNLNTSNSSEIDF